MKTEFPSEIQEVTLTFEEKLEIRSLIQRIEWNMEQCSKSSEYVAMRQGQRGLEKIAELRGLLVGLGVSAHESEYYQR